jgi:hypothetical protein
VLQVSGRRENGMSWRWLRGLGLLLETGLGRTLEERGLRVGNPKAGQKSGEQAEGGGPVKKEKHWGLELA